MASDNSVIGPIICQITNYTSFEHEEVAEDMTISVDDEESSVSDSRICSSSDEECGGDKNHEIFL
jgi:hypothetical protein